MSVPCRAEYTYRLVYQAYGRQHIPRRLSTHGTPQQVFHNELVALMGAGGAEAFEALFATHTAHKNNRHNNHSEPHSNHSKKNKNADKKAPNNVIGIHS